MTTTKGTNSDTTPEKSRKEKRAPLNLSDGQLITLVTRRHMGDSYEKLAEELGATRQTIANILSRPRAMEIAAELAKTSMDNAKTQVRTGLSRLVTKAVSVVEANLDEGDLAAAKLVFQGVGALDPEQEKTSDSNITIVMPGQAPPTEVISVVDGDNNGN